MTVEKKPVSLFRAKEYIEAMAPPSIEDIHGVVHTGRLLSFDEVLPLQEKIDLLATEKADPKKMKEVVTDICKAMDIPPEAVLSLPPKVMMQAVLHFFTSMFGQGPKPTNGSSPNLKSPTSTSD